MTKLHIKSTSELTPSQYTDYLRDGFLVIRQLAEPAQVQAMRAVALQQLAAQQGPIEYEADVAYPGAPARRDAQGGDTVRRLLQAYDREPIFADWARNEAATSIVKQLLNCDDLRLTRSHHNCVMTKHPGYSSATLWHQDLRYWSFEKPELINTWLALGDETAENGCMWLIPGSHRLGVTPERLDSAKFLRPELAANEALIEHAQAATLHPGDVLFFHAGVFHAAGRNQTDQLKLSTVFTYYGANNTPIAGSKSAKYPSATLV